MKFKLKSRYYKTVIHRVLPNVKYNFKAFKYLYSDKNIKRKFNNIAKYQYDIELYTILKQHGFDTSLADQIKGENLKIKEKFFEQVRIFQESCLNKDKNLYMCGITDNHLLFIEKHFISHVFPNGIPSFVQPALAQLIFSINKQASQGLPDPFIKKKDILDEITNYMQKFYNKSLSLHKVFTNPAALFIRLQIRGSGLKVRLVHAVQAFQQALESYYYLYFSSGLQLGSAITLGLTQIEISKLANSYTEYYTYSLDHKAWDLHRQPILSVISFDILEQILPLNIYEVKMLRQLRNLYLTLTSFHPSIELRRRHVGTVSGSGFTSLDNSLSNLIFMYIVIYDYCIFSGIDPFTFDFKINVNGDDIIFGTKFKIDEKILFKLAKDRFNVTVQLEYDITVPGDNRLFYLGSEWRNGLPYRKEKQMVASMVFSRTFVPGMTISERLRSRFLEIFGNSSDALFHFNRLKIKLGTRFYFYNELYRPFLSGTDNSVRSQMLKEATKNITKDPRGFWYDFDISSNDLNRLWESR
jgi:hypothetical protein